MIWLLFELGSHTFDVKNVREMIGWSVHEVLGSNSQRIGGVSLFLHER